MKTPTESKFSDLSKLSLRTIELQKEREREREMRVRPERLEGGRNNQLKVLSLRLSR
jgi:hypothetical protein